MLYMWFNPASWAALVARQVENLVEHKSLNQTYVRKVAHFSWPHVLGDDLCCIEHYMEYQKSESITYFSGSIPLWPLQACPEPPHAC